MGMVLLRVLGDRFQAQVWTQALEAEGIPHLLRTYEDTAYDGLFITQKGFASLYVEEAWLERAQELDAALAGQARPQKITPAELAAMIDHTLLDPNAGPEELEEHLAQCLEMGAAAACIPPWLVSRARQTLAGSPVRLCTVVCFPLGMETAATKAHQAAELAATGAQELDVVFNRGLALAGELGAAVEEIAQVVEAARPSAVKVILECSALGPELSAAAAERLARVGVAWLKTGTGFFGPATTAEVGILAAAAPSVPIKAAGGIRTLEQALALIQAGAERLGTSSGWEIFQAARQAQED
jgi:deoxyribose-phosphate aldolase